MTSLLNSAGIYRIVVYRGDKPPKYYIGQASILRKRRDVHFRTLRLGTHKTGTLQRAFAKYGRDAFRFEVLLICERRKEIMDFYEQTVVDSYDPELLYNMNLLCIGSRLGRAMRAETKAKIGAGNKGKARSPEHCDAVRQSNSKRVVSEETRAKMSAVRTGKKFPGRMLSAEHKANVGAFFRGRKKPHEEIMRRLATRAANRKAAGIDRY